MTTDFFHELLLQLAPLETNLGKACRDDHEGAHAPGGAIIHHAEDGLTGNCDDSQVCGLGYIADRRVCAETPDFAGLRIHRVDRTREAASDQGIQKPIADACWVAGDANYRHSFRSEERCKRFPVLRPGDIRVVL
jgi:hypothetical protein